MRSEKHSLVSNKAKEVLKSELATKICGAKSPKFFDEKGNEERCHCGTDEKSITIQQETDKKKIKKEFDFMIYHDFSDLYELLLPYSELPCKECGRVRLLQYRDLESGAIELICEKCDYNNTLDIYEPDTF